MSNECNLLFTFIKLFAKKYEIFDLNNKIKINILSYIYDDNFLLLFLANHFESVASNYNINYYLITKDEKFKFIKLILLNIAKNIKSKFYDFKTYVDSLFNSYC